MTGFEDHKNPAARAGPEEPKLSPLLFSNKCPAYWSLNVGSWHQMQHVQRQAIDMRKQRWGVAKILQWSKLDSPHSPNQAVRTKGHFNGWKLFLIYYFPRIIKRKSLFFLLLFSYILDWNTSFWSSLPSLSIRGNISSLLLVYKLAELHLRPVCRTIVPKKKRSWYSLNHLYASLF